MRLSDIKLLTDENILQELSHFCGKMVLMSLMLKNLL